MSGNTQHSVRIHEKLHQVPWIRESRTLDDPDDPQRVPLISQDELDKQIPVKRKGQWPWPKISEDDSAPIGETLGTDRPLHLETGKELKKETTLPGWKCRILLRII